MINNYKTFENGQNIRKITLSILHMYQYLILFFREMWLEAQ